MNSVCFGVCVCVSRTFYARDACPIANRVKNERNLVCIEMQRISYMCLSVCAYLNTKGLSYKNISVTTVINIHITYYLFEAESVAVTQFLTRFESLSLFSHAISMQTISHFDMFFYRWAKKLCCLCFFTRIQPALKQTVATTTSDMYTATNDINLFLWLCEKKPTFSSSSLLMTKDSHFFKSFNELSCKTHTFTHSHSPCSLHTGQTHCDRNYYCY